MQVDKPIWETTHAEHQANAASWAMFMAAYEGGRSYSAGVLKKYKNEDAADFKDRQDKSWPLGISEYLVKARQAYIISGEITTETPLDPEILDNLDLKGNNFITLLDRITKESEIYGPSVIVVDMQRIPDDVEVKTLQDEKNLGLRPYWTILPPASLLNWGLKQDGNFEWALVKQPESSQSLEIGTDNKPKIVASEAPAHIIWTDKWIYLIFTKKEMGKETKVRIDDIPNILGRVPIVVINYENHKDNLMGRGLLTNIVAVEASATNSASNLDNVIDNQTFSQMIYPGKAPGPPVKDPKTGKPVIKKLETGTMRIIPYNPKDGGTPAFISPDASQGDLIIKAIDKKMDFMHIMAILSKGYAREGKIASGIAKAYDFLDTNYSLKKQAKNLENGTEELLYITGLWQKKTEGRDAYNVTFPTDFGVMTGEAMIDAFAKLFSGLSPAADALKVEFTKKIARMYFGPEFSEKELASLMKKIEADISDAPDFGAEPATVPPKQIEPKEDTEDGKPISKDS